MKYYLAHPFDTRIDMRHWELQCEVAYDIEIHNPFYDTPRKDVVGIDEGRHGRYEKLDPNELVPRDVASISECDAIIAYVNGALSYGTIMEIVYAHQLNRDVSVICTNGHENHPWLVYHSDRIFTSLREFEEWIDLNAD